MTNILLDRIKRVKLTKQQKEIADYFLENLESIGQLSSVEVAEKIGVSDASIIRFSRAIGFDGFADLKAQIYSTLVEDSYAALSLSERLKQSHEAYPEEDFYNEFIDLMQENIIQTFINNNPTQFQNIVNNLISAKGKYIVGLRGCRGIALQFSRLLGFMLPEVVCINDSECPSISQIQDIDKDDCLLMFVLARYYKADLDYLRLAKNRNAKICLVTDSKNSILADYGQTILLTQTKHMSFFNSLIGVSAVAEYLLTLIERQVDFKERIEERDRLTQSQRLN